MRANQIVMAAVSAATVALALVAGCEGRGSEDRAPAAVEHAEFLATEAPPTESANGVVRAHVELAAADAPAEAIPPLGPSAPTAPTPDPVAYAPMHAHARHAAQPSPFGAPDHGGEAFGALGSLQQGFANGSGRGAGGPSALGHGGGGRGQLAAPPPTPAALPLPTSGVLASTFVGGNGASARLEDLLDRGVMVGGRNVRLEAFDELGRLPYAVPTKAVALYADLERTKLLTGGEQVHLQIAIMAREGELPARPRMDVRLVLDRSGSMEGDKWTQAVAAAHALVDRLRPTDTFGLVSYSDFATTDLAAARVGDRRAAHAAIDRLAPGGGTNIDGALETVQASPPRRQNANDVLLVVLLSDGQATVGQTSPDAIASRARTLFDATGAITTTVGVGTDFDEATMLGIARESSGSYYFVRRSADIAQILTDELEQRAQAVAQDLRLRIELAPGVVPTQVYGSRLLDQREAAAVRTTEVAVDQRVARELGIARDRQTDDQRGLRMHIPTFRRGDQHVVLMELSVPPGTDLTQVATVSLDWKDLVGAQNDHAAVRVSAERTRDADVASTSTNREVKRTVLAFRAASALQTTAAALDRGDSAGAQRALDEQLALLRTARDLWRDGALDRDVHLLEQYRDVVATAWPAWDDGSRHTLVLAMNYYGDRRMR